MATRNLWPHTVSVLLALSGSDSATEVQAAGLSLSGTGITFPDASVQQTAPFPPLPARMVWVAKADGDYVSPVDAINDLATWCPLRSETNPCVMLIAPGLYDLGDQSVHTVDWVSIIGSGREATVLRGGGSPDRCVVSDEGTAGESSMVLKDLTVAATVNSTSNDACAVGTRNENGSSISLEGVSATASGGNANLAIKAHGRSTLTQVSAVATGGTDATGIEIAGIWPCQLTDVSASASGASASNIGIDGAFGNKATLANVTVTASGGANTIGIRTNGPIFHLGNMSNVSASATVATASNYGIHLTAVGWWVMTDIVATASDGTQSIGIYNQSPFTTLIGTTASAEQGGTNRGIYNSFSTYDVTNRPVLKQVVAKARGTGATNHGIYNGNAAPLMQGVLATAEEGSSNYGVTNNNSTPTIQASHLEGGTAGLVISALPTGGTVTGTYVTDTRIQGGVDDADGSTNCRNTYSVVTSVIVDEGC